MSRDNDALVITSDRRRQGGARGLGTVGDSGGVGALPTAPFCHSHGHLEVQVGGVNAE
jgi:hypothetical protein